MTELSLSNDWWTEDELYDQLIHDNALDPQIDVAASEANTKCPFYWSIEDSALDKDWVLKIDGKAKIVDVWCNPPLGKGMTRAFTLKAYEQWQKWNMNILMLIPAGVIARGYFLPIWRRFVAQDHIEIEPMIPRPKFLYKGQPTKWSARNDYITLFFKKK